MGYRAKVQETQVMRRVGNPPELENDPTVKLAETPPPDLRVEFTRPAAATEDGKGEIPSHIIAVQISGAGVSSSEQHAILQKILAALNG